MDNPYQSPQDAGEARARFRLTPRGVKRGIVVFVLAWFLLAVVGHVLMPSLSTGEPAEERTVSSIVGAVVIGVSAVLGVAEALLASRIRPKREK